MAKEERRGPAHVSIARTLGVAIVTGDHPVGSTLPGELDLAAAFGVSRSVIREALRMLSAKGLVESRPKAGTRVRDRAQWNLLDPELLAWMFEGAPSLSFVRSLFQLRMIVEPAAAELAARLRTDAQLARMGDALATMTDHGLRTREGQDADQRFHATILEATDNELLVSLSSSIAAAVRWTTFFKYRAQHDYLDPIPLHKELYDAIAANDADTARRVIEQLIAQAERDTEKALAS